MKHKESLRPGIFEMGSFSENPPKDLLLPEFSEVQNLAQRDSLGVKSLNRPQTKDVGAAKLFDIHVLYHVSKVCLSSTD